MSGAAVIEFIERECRVPEGALVGQPIRLRPWQKRIIRGIYDSPTRLAIISFGRKNGKGLALDTPIPTPNGWRTMGQLQVGDEVFGSDGKPTRIEFVSPIHIGLRCWRLTFSDGSSIVADEQHQWLTRHSYRPWANARRNGSGHGGRWITGVVTTPQIAESVNRRRKDGVVEHNHKIDVACALESRPVDLPIDPYVLGAWLGDGASASAIFTCGDNDLSSMVAFLSVGLGHDVVIRRYSGKAATIRTPKTGLQSQLRAIGVLGDKHIPDQYFDAGTAQRWSLLQGLMDTDGTVSRNGGRYPRASFTGVNHRLCSGLWRLARSLGLKATIRKRQATLDGRVIGDKWDVAFPVDRNTPVFRLERKQALLPESLSGRSATLTITACDPVESVPTVCIQVASANRMFLAGHGCIPTHNSALSAMLLLAHLVGPKHRINSQLYSAAQSRDQASILFALAAKMVRMSPVLSQYVVVRDTAKQLFCPELGTLYRALSAEASTAYGLSPAFAVHDELGQVKGPRSELYDAIETAAGAQESPLSVIISTQAADAGDLLSMLIDDAQTKADPTTKVWLYTAPDDSDPWSVKTIKLANPAYGDFQNAEEVRRQAAKAKRMPAAESSYRNLILNQRVQSDNPFVSRSVWDDNAAPIDEELFFRGPVYAGLDLSDTEDLTALVMIARDEAGCWHVRPEFFTPKDTLHDRAKRDRAPYDVWRDQGYLIATPGRSVDMAWVADRLARMFEESDVKALSYDRWGMKALRAQMQSIDLDPDQLPLEEFGQGFRDMSPALKLLRADLVNNRIRHGNHPVLRWCAANAIETRDPAGNIKLNKAKSSGRIDGMVALAMAMGRAAQFQTDGPSIYEQRGILTL